MLLGGFDVAGKIYLKKKTNLELCMLEKYLLLECSDVAGKNRFKKGWLNKCLKILKECLNVAEKIIFKGLFSMIQCRRKLCLKNTRL